MPRPTDAETARSIGSGGEAEQSERVIACEFCGGDGGGEGPPRRWSTDGSGDWIKCTACDGTGEQVIVLEPVTLEDIEADSVPVERLSLGDWRRLYEATPGRNPTCGEIARFSERGRE